MDAERWRQISRLYHSARSRAATERRAFLDSACGDDEELRDEIEALLADETRAEAFLTGRGEAFPTPADGDAEAGAAAQPGAILGNYRIDRLLGRGGMGAVFLAYDAKLRRQVALKVMAGPADGETSRARLLREARNAAALNHPHICTIHEVGDANGSAFIAMEYVEGRSLRDLIDEKALTLDAALRYARQAADGLAYAHEHGVVHRDFKAANAIVTETGRLKIVDFGLARRGDAMMAGATTVASLVPEGAAAGTPYAMAPEQVRGEATDARADVWALGVLLAEMVSGAKPFDALTIPELFSSILRDRPAPLPDTVPVELKTVIERCLEKDVARRYQRAADVKTALDAIQTGSVNPWTTWWYRIKRRPGLASAAAALTAAALLVGLNVGNLRDRLTRVPPVAAPIKLAVLPFGNLTGDPQQEYFSDGLTEEMITALGRLHPQRLSVIARTSSMRYKNTDTRVDAIGRELGVDYLLEGSVRREGSRVRIGAKLIQVSDQTERWGDTFDSELASILTLQSDVARGVAASLALTLLPDEQARLASARPVIPEAYEAYLGGISHAGRLTRADLDAAEKYFELALTKDPNYALAYAGLAKVWSGRQQMQFIPPSEAAPRLKAAAAKALELDSTLPEVHHRLANQITWTDWNWAAAEPEFRRAIELGPNLAEARAFYAHYLYMMKRPIEGRAQMKRALELDPFSEQIQSLYGVTLGFEHRFDEEASYVRNVLKTNPASPMATTRLPELLDLKHEYDEALAAEKTRWSARGDREMEEALSRGFSEGGYTAALRRAIDTLEARSNSILSIATAKLCLRAGQKDRALDWLERAYDLHDPNVPYLGVTSIWDPLRDEPRFRTLIKRLNLPT